MGVYLTRLGINNYMYVVCLYVYFTRSDTLYCNVCGGKRIRPLFACMVCDRIKIRHVLVLIVSFLVLRQMIVYGMAKFHAIIEALVSVCSSCNIAFVYGCYYVCPYTILRLGGPLSFWHECPPPPLPPPNYCSQHSTLVLDCSVVGYMLVMYNSVQPFFFSPAICEYFVGEDPSSITIKWVVY